MQLSHIQDAINQKCTDSNAEQADLLPVNVLAYARCAVHHI